MSQDEIRAVVSMFIKRNYLFDEQKVLDPSASFLRTGVLDSTGILELITFIEEEFNVSFPDDDLTSENFDSVDRVVATLERKRRNGSNGNGGDGATSDADTHP
jgi:acyl carrier protein